MAKTRTSNTHPLAAWALIASGVLFLLGILFSHIGISGTVGQIVLFLAYALLAVAFVVLFLWRSIDILLRVAFIVGAVGWALLALSIIATVGGGLILIAAILALVGTLVAGVIVFARNIFSRSSSIAFLVLAIIAAILLLPSVFTFALDTTLAIIIDIVFGAMLIVAGFFMYRRR